MDTMQALLTRRSVRKFTFQVVQNETIEVLLRAAMHAPSARNRQPWHFYVTTERDVLRKIPDVHPFAAMTQEASLAVVVCGDETILSDAKRWGIDCAAATQNLLLSAHALGLGAVWCGVYPDPERQREIKNLLKLPDRIHPFSLVPIGFPAEPLPIVDRFLPERIHTNAW